MRRSAFPGGALLSSAFSRASELATRSLTLPFLPDELYRVPTADGAAIALGRYHPRGPRRFEEPVVLCHGLGANRFALDFDERYSLARHLARNGFETWVLELRGRGLAGPPLDASFDDQAQHDVGAALRAVVSTGAKEVTWVGHSKGGLLLYAHLAHHPQAKVRAGVAIASPVTFEGHAGLQQFVKTVARALELGSLPLGQLSRSVAWFGLPPAPIGPYLLHADNTDLEVIRKAIANVAADVPGGVTRQFAQWIRTGRFDSADGKIDYRANLGSLKLPMLLIAGTRDLLAPSRAVFAAQALLGGPTTTLLAGKAEGFRNDYGHGDLVLGRHAPDELFPRIEAFLAASSTPV